MTPQDIITSSRYVLNDTATPYRQSDTELLGYVNDGIREVSAIIPEQFIAVGDHVCTASQSEQNFSASVAQSILRVINIKGSTALTPFDMATMDTFKPGWKSDTPAVATQWAQYPGDSLRFFVYPPAPATTQTLSVLYVKVPTPLLIGDSITEVPVAMQVALIDYVIGRASSKDDETASSGLAAAEYGAFVAKIKGV